MKKKKPIYYTIANLKRLAVFYKQDFKVKKNIQQYLRKKYGYNNRLNIYFIKTKHTNKLERMLRRKVTVYNNKRKVRMYLKFIRDLNSYKSHRYRRLLPVRGQRTKTNAKTNRKKTKK
jgi:small subunit ribosomal protein S13